MNKPHWSLRLQIYKSSEISNIMCDYFDPVCWQRGGTWTLAKFKKGSTLAGEMASRPETLAVPTSSAKVEKCRASDHMDTMTRVMATTKPTWAHARLRTHTYTHAHEAERVGTHPHEATATGRLPLGTNRSYLTCRCDHANPPAEARISGVPLSTPSHAPPILRPSKTRAVLSSPSLPMSDNFCFCFSVKQDVKRSRSTRRGFTTTVGSITDLEPPATLSARARLMCPEEVGREQTATFSSSFWPSVLPPLVTWQLGSDRLS